MSTASQKSNFQGTDRFEVVGQLGSGGMGVVYDVIDRKRNARVALKFLPQVAPESLFAFKHEFRALADVSHPNLVGLYELFSDNQQSFFTMELVDGVDIRSHILGIAQKPANRLSITDDTMDLGTGGFDTDKASNSHTAFPAEPTVIVPPNDMPSSKGPSSPLSSSKILPRDLPNIDEPLLRRLYQALRQLAQGLKAMHSRGFVHRDIKPPNVLVCRDGRVVVLDFGLASESQGSRDRQSIVGTVAYMSPEQANGLPPTPASDWYSVGATLYEVLTGQAPFEGEISRLLQQKLSCDAELINRINPAVPKELNQFIMSLLARDPKARPDSAQVLSWLDATEGNLSTSAQSPTGPAASSTESTETIKGSHFVGRLEQLEQMLQDYTLVRQGGTAVVLVRGESGSGKTALVQRFLEQLPSDGKPIILSGRCYEQESVPFKAFDSLIDLLTRHLERMRDAELASILPRDVASLTRIFPVVQRIESIANAPGRTATVPDQMELRRRGFAALRELLARLGDRHPLILLIDDLQWGDVDSANLFNELIKPPDPPVMMVLGTYRAEDEQRSDCLRLLSASVEANYSAVQRRVISLSALSQTESIELAMELLGQGSPQTIADAEQIVRESKGSPYFLSELAQHVRAGIHLESQSTSDPAAESSSQRIHLDDALWRRIELLPDEARVVLEVLAVASRPVRLADVLAVANVSESHAALARLRNDRFLRATSSGTTNSDGEFLAPYHDRIRETVIARLSSEALRLRHLGLVTTLAVAGNCDSQMLATHYEGAGDAESAGRYYASAADEAARALAFEQAAKLYRKSLELRPSSGAERCELVVRMADALANSGRGVLAAESYLQAAQLADADAALMLQSKAGFNFCAAGDIDSGRAALSKVLDHLGMPLPKTRWRALGSLVANRVRLSMRGTKFRERPDAELSADERMRLDVTWLVAAGLFVIDTIRGTDFSTRNFLLALKTGEPYRVARSIAWESVTTAMEGIRTEKRTKRLLAEADHLAKRLEHPHASAMTLMGRGVSEFWFGRWPSSTKICDQAVAAFTEQCTGVAWELGTANAFAYWALFWSGDFAEIQRRYPRLMAAAEQLGDRLAVANYTTFGGPFVFLSQDDPDAAERALDGAMGQWSKQDFHTQHFTSLSARTYVLQYRRKAVAAWELMTAQWPAFKSAFLLQVECVRIYMMHLRGSSAIAAAAELRATGQLDARISGGGRLWSIGDLEAEAAFWAKKLNRERAPYARPMAAIIQAALDFAAGRNESAAERLLNASTELRKLDTCMYAASAQYQLGRLMAGDAGRQHLKEAEQWIRSQNVVRPDRIANLFAPGFAVDDS